MNDRARDLVAATPLGVDGWLSPLQQGLTGSGQIVGLADTGLDIGSTSDIHPDLASVPGNMPKVVMLQSLAGAPVAADPMATAPSWRPPSPAPAPVPRAATRVVAPGASIYFQGLTDRAVNWTRHRISMTCSPRPIGRGPHSCGRLGRHRNGGYQDTASQTDHFIREHPDFLVILQRRQQRAHRPGA